MDNNNSMNKRLVNFDLMRIIASFCVIIIHVSVYNQSDGFNSIDNVFSSIYGTMARWAVPCFMMLSGAMFLNINKDIPLKKLYGKYVLRLAVSYVFWSIVYALYNSIYEAGDTLFEKIKYLEDNLVSGEIHMWYVLVTIGFYIALPILRKLVQALDEKTMKYWLWTMFIFASIVPFVSELKIPVVSGYIAYINEYMEPFFFIGYTLFFVLGYYMINTNYSVKTKRIIYILGFVGFIYSLFVLIIGRPVLGFAFGALTYLYPNIIIMSLAMFLFTKDIVSKIQFKDKTESIIVRISKLTYGIFLIHVLVLRILYRLGVNLSIAAPPISMLIVSLITFIVSGIIMLLISCIPVLNKYIM